MTGHSLFRPLRAFGGNGVIDGYVFVEHNLSVNGIVVDRFYLKAQIVIQQDLALAVEQVVVGGGSHTAVKNVVQPIQVLPVPGIQLGLKLIQTFPHGVQILRGGPASGQPGVDCILIQTM